MGHGSLGTGSAAGLKIHWAKLSSSLSTPYILILPIWSMRFPSIGLTVGSEMDGKQIAIAVVVEDSGNGSTYAVPVAQKIFDLYFRK